VNPSMAARHAGFEATKTPPADWSGALRPEDGFAEPKWLALFAGRVPPERRWFVLRGADGTILAGTAGHVQRAPSGYAPLDVDVLRPGASPFWPPERATGAGEPLELPCLWLVHPGLASFVSGPERTRRSVVAALVGCVSAWARAHGSGTVVWPYVGAADTTLGEVLEDQGYTGLPITQEAWLPVPTGGWEEHLGTLPARRQAEIRR
jgi:hypothetical protein